MKYCFGDCYLQTLFLVRRFTGDVAEQVAAVSNYMCDAYHDSLSELVPLLVRPGT